MKIQLMGNVTGEAEFDDTGTAKLTVVVNRAMSAASAESCSVVNYARSAGSATSAIAADVAAKCTGNAATATSAEQDGLGNVINSTYATKAELNKLAENVPAFKFTLTGGVLTISNGNKSYQFVGTAV